MIDEKREYGVQSDGSFWAHRVSDLCDWLTEHVLHGNLEAGDGDRETEMLRNLLRLRKREMDFAARTASMFEDPASVEILRVRARRVAEDVIAPSEYVDPVEERLRDEGYVRGLESAIMMLAGRYLETPGFGGVYRAPRPLVAATDACRRASTPCGFASCEVCYGRGRWQ